MPCLKPHQRSPALLQHPKHDFTHPLIPNCHVDGGLREEETEVGSARVAGAEHEELALEVAGEVGAGFEAETCMPRGVVLSERWSIIHSY